MLHPPPKAPPFSTGNTIPVPPAVGVLGPTCSPPLYLSTLITESIHFHQTQCLRDKYHISFIPEAGATQSLMEETPQGDSVVGSLLIVPSLPTEGVSGLHRDRHLSPSKPLPPPPPGKTSKVMFSPFHLQTRQFTSMFSAPNVCYYLILITLRSSDCCC